MPIKSKQSEVTQKPEMESRVVFIDFQRASAKKVVVRSCSDLSLMRLFPTFPTLEDGCRFFIDKLNQRGKSVVLVCQIK